MSTYKMKFSYDWGSGICLWSTNQAAHLKFGNYPIYVSKLPISDKLKDELEHLIQWHDEALNWDEPNGDLLWDDNQVDTFLYASENAYNRLCDELGSDYEIEFIKEL